MKDLNINLLRFHQREELAAELKHFDEVLPHAKSEDRGSILRRKESTKKQLESQSPVPLTGPEKDKLHALEQKLRTKITTNMPTDEVMRKNPPGTVDWQQRWEKANKHAIRVWKNIRIQLNPDSADRDLSNIERYRPAGQLNRMRSDAQIPGMMTYGDVPDEQWPFDAPKTTALEQVKQHYSEADAEACAEAAIDALDAAEKEVMPKEGFGPSGKLSAEKYMSLQQCLAKGREVLAKRRAEETQLNESLAAPVGPVI